MSQSNQHMQHAWSAFLADVSSQLSAHKDYALWFEPLTPLGIKGNNLVLRVPSSAFVEKLETDYINVLRNSMSKVFGKGIGLEYEVVKDATHNLLSYETSKKDMRGYMPAIASANSGYNAFRSNLNPLLLLDNFYVSTCNRMVHTAAMTVLDKPGNNPFNPLFIYGASGVGKTHILHAIGNEAIRRNYQTRVVYVSAQIFKMQYVEAAIRRRKPEEFVHYYQNVDLLLIDDIQELHEAVSTQNAFFQIFNNLKMLGKQIVITSDRPPVELKGLEERLYTRMKWGLTAELGRPDKALRRQVLDAKMREANVHLTSDVYKFIVRHADSNVRDIEGCLTSLMAHSLNNTPIDLSLAQRVISETVGVQEEEHTFADIINVVADYLHVSVDDIRGRSRKREVAFARQIVMELAKNHTDLSLAAIGQELGRRDHSTVIYAVRSLSNTLDTSEVLRRQYEEICTLLNL